MRVGPGHSAPPRWAVWLFIGLLAFGPALYGYDQGGLLYAGGATVLAYSIYAAAAALMVIQR